MSKLIVQKIKDLIKHKREMIEVFHEKELIEMYLNQISGLHAALSIIEEQQGESK